MPAGATGLTKTLDQIATNVATVGGIGARVYQGRKEFADADNFEAIVKALTTQSQGAFGIWFDSFEGGSQLEPGTGTFNAILLIPLGKNATTDCNTMYDLMVSVVKEMTKESSFQASGTVPKSFSVRQTTDEYEDGIAVFEISVSFQMPMFCGDL